MKQIFFIGVVIFSSLFGAEIDTRLYDGNSTLAYYHELAQKIDAQIAHEESDSERITTEKLLIKSLIELQQPPLPLEDLLPNTFLVKEGNISTELYFSYLNALTHIHLEMELLEERASAMQMKRKYLKERITQITSEEKASLQMFQLQYAFYRIKAKRHEATLDHYQRSLETGQEQFKEALGRVDFDIIDLEKSLASLLIDANVAKEKSVALHLAQERELMHNEKISEDLSQKLAHNQSEQTTLQTTKIDTMLLLALAYLQKDEKPKSLELFGLAKNELEGLSEDIKPYYQHKVLVIKPIFKDVAGSVVVALSNVEESAESLYLYIYKKLTENLFVFNEEGISAIDILKVLFVLVVGFLIAGFFKRRILSLATNAQKISLSSAKAVSSLGYYFIVFITFLVALKSIGLNLSNLGIIAGALSIGVGFGLQTVVSNLAAGIILMFERTMRLGDYIEVSDTIRGTVSDMKMRSTTVTTNDNIDVIIPNSSFIQNNVINWTLESDVRRIHIPFSVAYGTDNSYLEKTMLKALEASDLTYVRNSTKYPVGIWMVAMGASSVDYELLVWVGGGSTKRPSGTKSDFLKFIYATLNKHHIEIPFPQMDIHMKRVVDDA
jgi:potassium efflux system protein